MLMLFLYIYIRGIGKMKSYVMVTWFMVIELGFKFIFEFFVRLLIDLGVGVKMS